MRDFFIGLMSGTSSDGVDAALVEFTPAPRLHSSHFLPYAPALRTQILEFAAAHYHGDAVDGLGRLDTELGELFAGTALALINKAGFTASDVRAIGSHGQTIRHQPGGPYPFTLQIADPNVIAARTGIVTVADFRRRDVALGGQGAPLVPAFHYAVFADHTEARAVVNIGGIANITLLPADKGTVTGFDTGPGNVLMDLCSRKYLHKPHDADGEFAASGRVDTGLLQALLADDYFARAVPKSTGQEHFNQAWLAERLATKKFPAADVMATLCELTARSISDAIKQHAQGAKRVLLCGGGVHNTHLRNRIIEHLRGCIVESTEVLGIPPDWVEAVAFAWLARETLAGRTGNLPAVTGAKKAAVLGAVYHA
ncbi:MAG: anhydro-N-acetylmuramic acid kinase [Gammaproteobacteria bacterium]